jgi:ABC-2 type transport system permease protein
MSLARTGDKFLVILLRDLRTAARYRVGFAISAAGTMLELAAFYYLSRAIGPQFRPEGAGYFPFLLVGTGLYTFIVMGMRGFVRCVQEAQQEGTMEVLMTCSIPAPMVVLLSAASALVGNSMQLVFYVGAGRVLFGAPMPGANWWGGLVVFGLSLLMGIALGMIAAALQVAIQRGSAVLWIFGSGAWFLTGTLFPVEVLPKPLQFVSHCIPLTHSLCAMRMALLQGADFGSLAPEIRALVFFAAALLPTGLLMFSVCLRRARLQGTLAFY